MPAADLARRSTCRPGLTSRSYRREHPSKALAPASDCCLLDAARQERIAQHAARRREGIAVTRQSILAEVSAERDRQDRDYGARHDDGLQRNDWSAIAARHLGLASSDGAETDADRWRRQLIRLAAVAVAAIESADRKGQSHPELAARLQALADQHCEPVLLLADGAPGMEYRSRTPYGVLLSQASGWEKANQMRTIEPTKMEGVS
jgi:hypothetical protein